MDQGIKEAIKLLSSCLHNQPLKCEIVKRDDGEITVNMCNEKINFVYIIREDVKKDSNNIIRCYYDYFDRGDDEGAIMELIKLVLRRDVPNNLWHHIINRKYNMNEWSVANKMVLAQSYYEKRPFDEKDPFFSPDFIIIGTMKGGTTSLYDYLCHHPRIIPRHPKEIHFFTINYSKGIEEYRKFFSQKQEYSLIGEASPSYFDWNTPVIAQRIRKECPDVKLFLILADPVKRAISQYYHDLRIRKKVPLGHDFVEPHEVITVDMIKRHIKEGKDAYIKAGHYVERMQSWDEFLNNGQLLVFTQKQLAKEPNEVTSMACKLLGIEDVPLKLDKLERSNVNKYPKVGEEVIDFLSNYYESSRNKLRERYGIVL